MAKWGGIGIAVLTLVNSSITIVHRFVMPILTPELTMMISNIAVGGVVGLIFGWMRELDKKARTHYQKTTVLNRTLRHNLRNDVNVMLGQIELIENDLEGGSNPRLETLKRKTKDLQRIGDHARHVQEVLERSDSHLSPTDVVPVIQETIATLQQQYEGVEIQFATPDEVLIRGDHHLKVLFTNVIENAIEHNDRPDRKVWISVTNPSHTTMVEIKIDDNGPGLPEHEKTTLARGEETQLKHSNGTGLWVVQWLVSDYGGTVTFEENSPRGTSVRINLPESNNCKSTDNEQSQQEPKEAESPPIPS